MLKYHKVHKPKKPSTEPFIVYKSLIKHFGPQGWWPTTKPGRIHPEYYPGVYKRKTDSEAFEILVGAILTQNTAWTNVMKALVNLNKSKVLNPDKLAKINTGRLARLIKPSGYYNQKASKLKGIVSHFASKYKGRLSFFFRQDTETAREELLSLRGIGPETADSIMLYAGSKPVFVIDAYTHRISRRFGWYNGRSAPEYNQLQEYFKKNLPRSVKIYNEYHALLVTLGKDYCRRKPLCTKCPVRSLCKLPPTMQGNRERGQATRLGE